MWKQILRLMPVKAGRDSEDLPGTMACGTTAARCETAWRNRAANMPLRIGPGVQRRRDA